MVDAGKTMRQAQHHLRSPGKPEQLCCNMGGTTCMMQSFRPSMPFINVDLVGLQLWLKLAAAQTFLFVCFVPTSCMLFVLVERNE